MGVATRHTLLPSKGSSFSGNGSTGGGEGKERHVWVMDGEHKLPFPLFNKSQINSGKQSRLNWMNIFPGGLSFHGSSTSSDYFSLTESDVFVSSPSPASVSENVSCWAVETWHQGSDTCIVKESDPDYYFFPPAVIWHIRWPFLKGHKNRIHTKWPALYFF